MTKLYALKSRENMGLVWNISHNPHNLATAQEVADYLSIPVNRYLVFLFANGATEYLSFHWFKDEETCLKNIRILENDLFAGINYSEFYVSTSTVDGRVVRPYFQANGVSNRIAELASYLGLNQEVCRTMLVNLDAHIQRNEEYGFETERLAKGALNCIQKTRLVESYAVPPVVIQTRKTDTELLCYLDHNKEVEEWSITTDRVAETFIGDLAEVLSVHEQELEKFLLSHGANSDGVFQSKQSCVDAMNALKIFVEETHNSLNLYVMEYSSYGDHFTLTTQRDVLESDTDITDTIGIDFDRYIEMALQYNGTQINGELVFLHEADANRFVEAMKKELGFASEETSSEQQPASLKPQQEGLDIKFIPSEVTLQETIKVLERKQQILANCAALLQQDDLSSLIAAIELQQEESDDVLRSAFNPTPILIRIAEMLESMLPEHFTIYRDPYGIIKVDGPNHTIVLRYKDTEYFVHFKVSLREIQQRLSVAEQTLNRTVAPLYEQMQRLDMRAGLSLLPEINKHLQAFEEFKNAKTALSESLQSLNLRWSNL